MNVDYAELFRTVHPGFFEREEIRALPKQEIFEEQILDLRAFRAEDFETDCPAHIAFGVYAGDTDTLREAVRKVDADWVEYFSDGDTVYCAFDGGKLAAFCLLDDLGEYRGLRVGAPGCVGTLPEYRRRGIGRRLMLCAAQMLKEQGFDLSYIHYTAVGHWYEKLGYRTVLRWNAEGIVEE